MNPLRSLALVAFALSAATLSAQTSVYAVGGFSRWGTAPAGDGSYSYKQGTADLGGGLFYNFPIQSRVTVGVDGRVLGSPGNNGGLLAGAALRVGFVPHHNPLRPFFQIGAGFLDTTYSQTTYNYSVFGNLVSTTDTHTSLNGGGGQLVFGLDIRLTDSLDLRAPEYGAEAGTHVGAGFLNGGLVYHLHPRS